MASSVPSGTGGEASSAPVPPLAQLTPAKTQNVLGDVLLSRPRLQDLVREVDPAEQLDEEVRRLFLMLRANFYSCCS
jgi:transcription initiation factor TFIID subunit 12